MKKRTGKKSDLVCGACGSVAPIFRPSMKGREVGHVKHMYCSTCGTERPFIEHTAHGAVEKFWTLEAINNEPEYDVALSKGCRTYSVESGEFIELEEQIGLFTDAKLSMYEDVKRNDKVNTLINIIEARGYKIHVLEDNRPK